MDRDPNPIDLSALTGESAAYLEALTGEVTPQPSWKRANWPIAANGELVSALDGNWSAIEKAVGDKLAKKADKAAPGAPQVNVQQATRDSVRALMMIRAYRMRGHLHANLDPLGIEPRKDHEELHPSTYGFSDADWDRKIFIDNVLGLESATIREMLAILQRTYCSTIGYEFMHITDPAEKAWLQERIEGRTRRSPSPRRASAPSCRSSSRARASRSSSTSSTRAPSASASTAASR